MQIHQVEGGVCAPKGYLAGGIHCGIRKNNQKKDLALIVSQVPCTAAAVYTTNLVKGAPLLVTKDHLTNGVARAVICNSGNANTCNANGIEIAEAMSGLVEKHLAGFFEGEPIGSDDVIVASTGVIGEPLPIDPIADNMAALVASLAEDGSESAAQAIMTTDTVSKEVAVSFGLGDVTCHIGGIAKGSGMIHPNMATMLVFLTSDVKISAEMLQKALSEDVKDTFNMISIDGDTSTNDMVTVMANGLADNDEIAEEGEAFDTFCAALHEVMAQLCRMLAGDGEGATKLLTVKVSGAPEKETARTIAKSVICSSLVKAAMYGADANWGRVLCAIGYSGCAIDIDKVEVRFSSDGGEVLLCENGAGVAFSEEKAAKVLAEKEVTIWIDLHQGEEDATAWGCDLTHDYVSINADYRT